MIIYDQDKNEVNLVRDYMSKIEEKDWTFQIYQVKTIQELIVRASGLDDVSIYCVDYEDKSGSSAVNLFKERHPDSAIIIIAGMGISPALYLRPSVGATASPCMASSPGTVTLCHFPLGDVFASHRPSRLMRLTAVPAVWSGIV